MKSINVTVEILPAKFSAKDVKGFCSEIEGLLNSHRPRIVFDFSHVEHIDTKGVKALVNCTLKAFQNGGDIKFAGIKTRRVMAMLRLFRVKHLFEMYSTVEEAVESFTPPTYESLTKSAQAGE